MALEVVVLAVHERREIGACEGVKIGRRGLRNPVASEDCMIEKQTALWNNTTSSSVSAIERVTLRATWDGVVTSNRQSSEKVVHGIISELRQWYLRPRDNLFLSLALRARWLHLFMILRRSSLDPLAGS
jgi:hypothetical protein